MKKKLQNLIDVMQDSGEQYNPILGRDDYVSNSELAKFLLNCGVIAPFVRVGQTVWFLRKGEIGTGTIVNMFVEIGKDTTYSFNVSTKDMTNLVFFDFDIGETVFDREGKAEQALAERKEGDNAQMD